MHTYVHIEIHAYIRTKYIRIGRITSSQTSIHIHIYAYTCIRLTHIYTLMHVHTQGLVSAIEQVGGSDAIGLVDDLPNTKEEAIR